MEFEIITKTEGNAPYDHSAIAIKSIEYDFLEKSYKENEITDTVIKDVLDEIRKGTDIFFYLDINGETDYMNVLSGDGWITFLVQLCEENDEDHYYFCYNPKFQHTKELLEEDNSFSDELYTPLELGGQSPVPKIQALTDIEAGIRAAEYFIRTGKLSREIDWIKE